MDWFEHVFEFDKVEEVLKELREVLGNIPILMTFRTSKEGGEKAIEPEAYAELNIKAKHRPDMWISWMLKFLQAMRS